MREIKILPSLLSADFSNLGSDVTAVENCGAGGLHCDVMDGHFVPNITFGPMIVAAVRRLTDLPLDVHLMIEQPDRYVEAFVKAGAHTLTVHAEACIHLHRTLQSIRALGIRAGVCLNPSTSLSAIENVISDVDSILVMTVNPGFGGQSFIETMLPKIARAREMIVEAGADVDIAVDGGIDVDTAPRVVAAGANHLIAGSAVFSSDVLPGKACERILAAAMTALDRTGA